MPAKTKGKKMAKFAKFERDMQIVQSFAAAHISGCNPIMTAMKMACRIVEAAGIIPNGFMIRLHRANVANTGVTDPKPGTGTALLRNAERLLYEANWIEARKWDSLLLDLRATWSALAWTISAAKRRELMAERESLVKDLDSARFHHAAARANLNRAIERRSQIENFIHLRWRWRAGVCGAHLAAAEQEVFALEAEQERCNKLLAERADQVNAIQRRIAEISARLGRLTNLPRCGNRGISRAWKAGKSPPQHKG